MVAGFRKREKKKQLGEQLVSWHKREILGRLKRRAKRRLEKESN